MDLAQLTRDLEALQTEASAAAAAAPDVAALDALAQRAAADIDGQGDDLDPVLLPEPGDGDGRIESARVGEDDLFHRLGVGGGHAKIPWLS